MDKVKEKERLYLEETLNETKETRDKGLQEIKEWATSLNLEITMRLEDKYILPFLRGCKYNIERTKTKMTNFYTVKRDRPEWFSERNPHSEAEKELVLLGCCVALRETTKDNQVVMVSRPAAHDPKMYTIDEYIKAAFMVFDVACMEEENMQIYGLTAIVDMKGLTFGHVKQYTPFMIQRAAHTMINYYSRPQQLEFINTPYFFYVILNIFKSFLPEKLRNRVRVSNGDESVLEILGPELTPKEYGGNGDSMEFLGKHTYNKLLSYSKWFAEDEKYKAL